MIKTRILIAYAAALTLGACSNDNDSSDSASDNNASDSDSVAVDTIEVDTLSVDTAEILTDTIAPKEILGQEDKAQAANVTKKTYNLADYCEGLYNISMDLPAGCSFEYDSDYEELTLKFGNDFVIIVGEQFDDIATIKSKMKNTLHNQHLGYLKDEPNGIVKKSKSNGIVTHSLFYSVNDGTKDIMINSIPSHAYSQSEIMEMWKACQTVKVNQNS